MRKSCAASIIGAGLLAATLTSPPAVAITVGDGTLADWNVTVGDNNTSNFATVAPVGATLLGATISDNNDTSNSYNFAPAPGGPLGGGQDFDAEFMAAAVGIGASKGHLYVAIATGQRPDNGAATYQPGDLKITNIGGAHPGVYGIELGATSGAAITTTGGAGTTYKLGGSGNANGTDSTPAGQTIGAIFRNATFRTGTYGPLGNPGTQLDTNSAVHSDNNESQAGGAQTITGSGTPIGSVDAIYESGDMVTTQHQIIELEIDMETLLQTGSDHSSWASTVLIFQWGSAAVVDLITTFSLPPIDETPAPEPESIALFGLGVLGLGVARGRKFA